MSDDTSYLSRGFAGMMIGVLVLGLDLVFALLPEQGITMWPVIGMMDMGLMMSGVLIGLRIAEPKCEAKGE